MLRTSKWCNINCRKIKGQICKQRDHVTLIFLSLFIKFLWKWWSGCFGSWGFEVIWGKWKAFYHFFPSSFVGFSIFVLRSPSRALVLGRANPATKIIVQQLLVELPADHQVRLVRLNLRELSEHEREDFHRLMSSKEYEEWNDKLTFFKLRPKSFKTLSSSWIVVPF